MQPVLFELFGLPLMAHGTFIFLGVVTAGLVVWYEAQRRRWPKEEVIPITLAAFVGGMIGARISIVFFNGWELAPYVFNYYNLFDPRIGPGSILGAVAGAYISGYFAARVIGKEGCACDAFAPAMALGLAVGRIGDHLSAADGLGTVTTVPWGVPIAGVDYLVHPVALYDAGFNFLWFATLMMMRDHPSLQNGNLLKLGLAGYAVFRFFNEFFRTNQVVALGLTGQQFFCLGLLLLLGLYYGRHWIHDRPGTVTVG